jgi:hypothetical protein
VNFFKDVLNEGEELDEEELDEEELDEEELDEEELDETDHDIGKQEEDDGEYETEHDLGKGFQKEAVYVDDNGYLLDENGDFIYDDEEVYIAEGEYDDVDGDATPESGQAGLPNKPKVKQTKHGWEDNGDGDYSAEDPEKGNYNGLDDVPTPELGWKAKGAGTIKRAEDPEKGNRNGLDGVPTPKNGWGPKNELANAQMSSIIKELNARGILEDEDIDIEDLVERQEIDEEIDIEIVDDEPYEYRMMRSGVFESEDKEDDDDEELDVPEKLFDDDDDDDDDKDEKDLDEEEDVNVDVEDDDDESDEDDDDDDEEGVNENLYVRYKDGFMKISPAEYLGTRIEELTEERHDLIDMVHELQGQLQESQNELQGTHLYNAKLAHMNKLVMTGAFTNSEKERITEKLDECESVSDVKSLYKTIISEVQEMNPLDEFSRLIKEQRVNGNGESKTNNIYESSDVARMKKLVDYKFDKGK